MGAVANMKAVSPFITMVFTILFGVTMLAIIVNTVNPLFSRATDASIVNDAFQNLELLRSAVESVASEAQGSTRTVPLSVSGGTYRADATYDWLYFEYNPQEALQLSGQRGNVLVRQGFQFGDWFDSYASGAGSSAGWKNISGTWTFSDYKYVGSNGTSYHNVSGPLTNWKFSASISNVSGSTGGEAFAVPGNPESLVGYWTADEASGNTFYDWSGHGNTGSFSGNANGTLTDMNTTGNATSGWQSGASCKFGSCVSNIMATSTAGGYVNTTLNMSSWAAYTEAMWARPGNQTFGSTVNKQIFSPCAGICDGPFVRKTGFAANPSPHFAGTFRNNTNYYELHTMINATEGQWYFILQTYDNATGNGSLYVNGVLANSTYINSSGLNTLNSNFSYIGYGGSDRYFNGTIDDVKVWNRALSADEVLSEYNGTRSGETLSVSTNTTGLAGWWKFNEGSGSSAADDSTREYGQYAGAMKFEGVNDYTSVSSSPSLKPTEAITVAAWIKPNLQGTREFVATKWAGFTMELTTSNTATFGAYIDGAQRMTPGTTAIPNDTWTHLVGTYDSTEKIIKLYVNGGQEIKTLTLSGRATYSMTVSDNSLGIGKYSTYYWNGPIDEVMILNRSLSADEVAALYETSYKKISGAGGSQSINAKTPNPAIVLANPAGQTRFDNVEVTDGTSRLTFVVPFSDADINGTMRAGKGDHTIEVRNMGVNAASGRPVVQLTAS
jgi:hypothetical protein